MLACAEVLRILNTVWDPIGLRGLESFDSHTDNEYAGYAQALTGMLAHGADAARIEEYLSWAEEHMGVDVSPQRIQKVAGMLLSEHHR